MAFPRISSRGQRNFSPQETEDFQTPPPTPRQPLELEMTDDGVIYLNRILPLDPTYEDLPCSPVALHP